MNVKVSVLMSVFNGEEFLEESIESILNQTFVDFEFIIVNEFGSNSQATEIINYYKNKDDRIVVVENETRLGLAKSLNRGIDIARGEYIARMDADDISHPTRLEKQVQFLDANFSVGVLGTWQNSLTPKSKYLQKAPCNHEEIKAMMIFGCEMSHTSIMFRRKLFIENGWRYNPEFLGEDYELWIRIIDKTRFANLPEGLVDHRWGFENISIQKGELLKKEVRQISKNILLNIGVEIEKEDELLLSGWRSKPTNQVKNVKKFVNRGFKLLEDIKTNNDVYRYFDRSALEKVINLREQWIKDTCGIYILENQIYFSEKITLKKLLKSILKLDFYFISRKWASFNNNNKGIRLKLKKIFVIRRRSNIQNGSDESLKSIKSINKKSSEINKELINRTNYQTYKLNDILFELKKRKYSETDKISVIFLFQIASFWPSWKKVYEIMCNDKRFDVKTVLYDKEIYEKKQIETAESFLRQNGIPYEKYDELTFYGLEPHIMFIQTPYDSWHREPELSADNLKQMGIRLVYIPYGIEISDTSESRQLHFRNNVVTNAWKVYTFSDLILKDYYKYGIRVRGKVKAFGHPKFDYLLDGCKDSEFEKIKRIAGNRKIVLWKVHFPKKFGGRIVTPDIKQYIKFAKKICDFDNVFFVFMMHPKYVEMCYKMKLEIECDELLSILSQQKNVYFYNEDDYKSGLQVADCIIVDRSAIMIEAAAFNVPILYMYNLNYIEPVTDAIKDLMDSYYHGTTADDMTFFVNRCLINGVDEKKPLRNESFKSSINGLNDHCSYKIVEDIYISILKEN